MNYKKIDMNNYNRKDIYNHFKSMEHSMNTITIKLDITEWLKKLKTTNYPFFLSFQYAVVKAANKIPEFRQRIKDNNIIEYDFCNPSYTLLMPNNSFKFCSVNANQPFQKYLIDAQKKQELVFNSNILDNGTLDLLYISCSPWLNYESLSIVYPNNNFSIPNIIWGKYIMEKKIYLDNDKIKEKEVYTMPITIMVNHALVDAIHIKDFIDYLKEELNNMIETSFQ